jgi:hypothetical protein
MGGNLLTIIAAFLPTHNTDTHLMAVLTEMVLVVSEEEQLFYGGGWGVEEVVFGGGLGEGLGEGWEGEQLVAHLPG